MFTGRAKGHTLLELTVASSCLLVLLLLIFQLFVATKRYQDNCEAKIKLQEQVLKGMSLISQDLVESDRYAIAASTADRAICFATPRGMSGKVSFDPAGRLLWKKYVVYFVADSPEGVPTLYRKIKEIDPQMTDVPPPLKPKDVRDDPTLPARPVAKHIKTFVPTPKSDGTVELRLEGELQIYHRSYGCEVQGSVFPQN